MKGATLVSQMRNEIEVVVIVGRVLLTRSVVLIEEGFLNMMNSMSDKRKNLLLH